MRKTDHEPGAHSGPPRAGAARPQELEDWLNRTLYHPLSRRLALGLRESFVTPNLLSITGGAMVVLAAVIYALGDGVLWAVLGLLVHMSWHVFDGADGDLARLTGAESELGELIDGICDYAGHIVLYLVLAALLAEQIGLIGWVLMVASGFARVVQTAFYETQRRQYQWWVYGKPWLRVARDDADDGRRRGAMGGLAGGYLRLSDRLATGGVELDVLLSAQSASRRVHFVGIIRRHLIARIPHLSVLSSNYRTLVIGGAMIAGLPLLIVAFELVVLTLVLLIEMHRSGMAIERATAEIQASSER